MKEDDGLIVREITAGGSQMLSSECFRLILKILTINFFVNDEITSLQVTYMIQILNLNTALKDSDQL